MVVVLLLVGVVGTMVWVMLLLVVVSVVEMVMWIMLLLRSGRRCSSHQMKERKT
jgi:hypothetical protein